MKLSFNSNFLLSMLLTTLLSSCGMNGVGSSRTPESYNGSAYQPKLSKISYQAKFSILTPHAGPASIAELRLSSPNGSDGFSCPEFTRTTNTISTSGFYEGYYSSLAGTVFLAGLEACPIDLDISTYSQSYADESGAVVISQNVTVAAFDSLHGTFNRSSASAEEGHLTDSATLNVCGSVIQVDLTESVAP